MDNIRQIDPLVPQVKAFEPSDFAPPPETQSLNFKKVFNETIADVNGLNTQSKAMVEALATGKTNDVSGVMLSVRKSNLAFLSLLQIRNQIIEAYQEVMRMRM